MRSNFFLKSKIDAVSCISGLKRLKQSELKKQSVKTEWTKNFT